MVNCLLCTGSSKVPHDHAFIAQMLVLRHLGVMPLDLTQTLSIARVSAEVM